MGSVLIKAISHMATSKGALSMLGCEVEVIEVSSAISQPT